MGVTNEKSTQYIAEYGTPHIALAKIQNLKMEILPFDFTQGAAAGDATSTVKLRRLPAGLVYFFPFLSRFTCSDIGSNGTIDIGHGAYVGFDGVAVNASTALFDDDVDVSGQANQAAMGSDYVEATTANTGAFKKFESQAGVDILVTVNTSTIAAAAQIHGYLVIARP